MALARALPTRAPRRAPSPRGSRARAPRRDRARDTPRASPPPARARFRSGRRARPARAAQSSRTRRRRRPSSSARRRRARRPPRSPRRPRSRRARASTTPAAEASGHARADHSAPRERHRAFAPERRVEAGAVGRQHGTHATPGVKRPGAGADRARGRRVDRPHAQALLAGNARPRRQATPGEVPSRYRVHLLPRAKPTDRGVLYLRGEAQFLLDLEPREARVRRARRRGGGRARLRVRPGRRDVSGPECVVCRLEAAPGRGAARRARDRARRRAGRAHAGAPHARRAAARRTSRYPDLETFALASLESIRFTSR